MSYQSLKLTNSINILYSKFSSSHTLLIINQNWRNTTAVAGTWLREDVSTLSRDNLVNKYVFIFHETNFEFLNDLTEASQNGGAEDERLCGDQLRGMCYMYIVIVF